MLSIQVCAAVLPALLQDPQPSSTAPWPVRLAASGAARHPEAHLGGPSEPPPCAPMCGQGPSRLCNRDAASTRAPASKPPTSRTQQAS
eukprot:6108434-Pyramimonas_sp.AAC.1